MTPYLRAMAALLGGRGGFQVTPKGGRARTTSVDARPVAADLPGRPSRSVAIAYQTAAQILGLPGQLSAGRARDHRRLGRGQRRPGRLGRRLGPRHPPRALQPPLPGGPARPPTRPSAAAPPRPRRGRGPQPRGPRDDRLEEHPVAGERLRIVLLLDDGPMEVTGSSSGAEAGHDPGSWSVGVAFDDLEPRGRRRDHRVVLPPPVRPRAAGARGRARGRPRPAGGPGPAGRAAAEPGLSDPSGALSRRAG